MSDIIANITAGILIKLDKPFSVGDRIETPNGQIEGDVEKIGMLSTLIRTLDRRSLYIPNSYFTENPFANSSRRTKWWIQKRFHLPYSCFDRYLDFLKEVRSAIFGHDQIDLSEENVIGIDELGERQFELILWVYAKDMPYEGFLKVQEEVLLIVVDCMNKYEMRLSYSSGVQKFN